jgi:O-antigen/teichoic acid export membrane protein
MQQPLTTDESAPSGSIGKVLARNTLYLTVAQVLAVPLSVAVNAAMGRYLGAQELGVIYLAVTITGLGFLVIDWGHAGALPAIVARDHSSSGAVLGTSLVWRLFLAVIVYAVVAVGLHVFEYGVGLQWAVGLCFLGWLFNSIVMACKDAIRGFERTDIPSYIHFAQQALYAAFVVVVLALGGKTPAALLAGAVSALVMVPIIWRSLAPVGIGKLSVERNAARSLFTEGTPFVIFGLAMVLVPNIDALYLSKLAPPEVMGWYAASRRLLGMLLLPSTALIGALYPTLCRLWVTDKASFSRAASGSMQGTALLVVPVALGCALYPDIGVSIFSRKAFGPAEQNLQISAVFLCLVYFSMPIGTALLAAERKRIWSLVQGLCVLISLLLDPIFIRWSQKRWGNGGAGLCLTSVVSELFVVVAGVALMPRGVFDRRLARSLLFSVVAGAAMAGIAWVTRPIGALPSAVLAVIAYAVTLWVTGGLEKAQMDAIRGFMGRVFLRLGFASRRPPA